VKTEPWIELWIDWMGLIVTLSGEQRFRQLEGFNWGFKHLKPEDQATLKQAIRARFCPSNGEDGCQGAMESVRGI
jgi:hypothetical protein